MTVTITVTGTHEVSHPPERCTVHLQVQFDGADAQRVWASASRCTADLRTRIVAAGDDVEDWFADQIRRSRHRPYDPNGVQLPYVHTASADVRVRYSNLEAIGPFVDDMVDLDGIEVRNLAWALTDERRAGLIETARDRAVQDAVAKATSYARSLGLTEVHPVAVSDVGLLDAPIAGARVMSAMAGGQQHTTMKPEDITVSAQVHARFEAS